MTVYEALDGSASAQGVLQLWPFETLASAPAGVDSKRTVSITGAGLKSSLYVSALSQSGVSDDEHATSASPAPTTARTRNISVYPSTQATEVARPNRQITVAVVQVQPFDRR